MDQVLFLAFSALAVLAALAAVTRKNAVASACWLVVMFFGLAAVFVLQQAFFVATTQILVYAGAIMVLFLFVIMLLDLRSVELAAHRGPRLRFAGVLLAGAFLGAVLYAFHDAGDSVRGADRVGVVLRRPDRAVAAAPAAPAADDAGKPAPAPEVLVAVAPERIALEAERVATAPREEVGEAAEPGDRAWGADVVLDATQPAATTKHLQVAVAPEGGAVVLWGGKALPSSAWTVAGRERRATFGVPGAAEGTLFEVTVVRGGLDPAPAGGPDGSARAIGRSIFEHNLLPFEVASILLTGAIFGAVVLTKRRLA